VTFDPLLLLRLAESMDHNTEAGARTAINRAYYGVFLKARDSLLSQGLISSRGAGQEHGEVVWALRANYRTTAALELSGLRRRRERADYDTGTSLAAVDAASAIRTAHRIERLMSRDWNPA